MKNLIVLFLSLFLNFELIQSQINWSLINLLPFDYDNTTMPSGTGIIIQVIKCSF